MLTCLHVYVRKSLVISKCVALLTVYGTPYMRVHRRTVRRTFQPIHPA